MLWAYRAVKTKDSQTRHSFSQAFEGEFNSSWLKLPRFKVAWNTTLNNLIIHSELMVQENTKLKDKITGTHSSDRQRQADAYTYKHTQIF